MTKPMQSMLYILAMVTTIVLVDFSFFKGHTIGRLAANVGIVLVYLSFYLRFLKRG